jgi:septal ring-binding cell division protein DamX
VIPHDERGDADNQNCHGHRCRTRSAVTSAAAATSVVASVPVESPAPAESSDSEDDGESTASPTSAVSTKPASSVTSAKPAGTSAAPPTSGGGGSYWKPSMSDTFVVDLENIPIPSNAASVYIVDLAHSADQM